MNVIFFIPYYNNSHFLDIQIKSFSKYLLNCNWKICVVDDSTEQTINVISNQKETIQECCSKYQDHIIYFKFPQELHSSTNVTIKHQTILNYIIQKMSPYFMDEYDYMSLLDADMCFIDFFDVNTELENYDIIAPKRIQWLSNIQISDSPIFEFIWVHCCFFNLKTMPNLTTMNMNSILNTTTDTGAMILEYIHNNPQYKIKFLPLSSGAECIEKLYDFEFFWNTKIIHFGSGSLWNSNGKRNYINYLKIFEAFCEMTMRGLTSVDKQHIYNTYNEKWNKFHLRFTGKKYTSNDLLLYGMNVTV